MDLKEYLLKHLQDDVILPVTIDLFKNGTIEESVESVYNPEFRQWLAGQDIIFLYPAKKHKFDFLRYSDSKIRELWNCSRQEFRSALKGYYGQPRAT